MLQPALHASLASTVLLGPLRGSDMHLCYVFAILTVKQRINYVDNQSPSVKSCAWNRLTVHQG